MSYITQDNFLKDYEKVPGYKAHFEFQNRMHASIRSQTTSLVPLFKLTDEVMKVKLEVDNTLKRCRAIVVGDQHTQECFSGCDQEPVSAMFRPLQSGPIINIAVEEELELNDLCLYQDTENLI